MNTFKSMAAMVLATLCTISCNNTSDKNRIEVKTDAVDFTAFNKKVIGIVEASNCIDDLFQENDFFPDRHIVPDPKLDNTIGGNYHWNHTEEIDQYREVYNLNIIGSNLFSIMEIVGRELITGEDIPSQEWTKERIDYNADALQLTSSKEWLTSTVEYLIDIVNQLDSDSIDEDIDIYGPIFDFSDLICEIIEDKIPTPQSDSVEFAKIANQVYDWFGYVKTEEFQAVRSIEDDYTRAIEFLKLIENAEDFETQCAYALCAENIGMVEKPLTLIVLDKLINSGHYSRYQYQTWLGWRSIAQIINFGRSRDSDIADQWYNEVRKSAMLANLAYMDSNPDDLVARLNYILTCIRTNIIRNGSFMLGSDASLDYWEVFQDS